MVGVINTACALVAYHSFIPKSSASETFITSSDTGAGAPQPQAPAAITPPPANTQVSIRKSGKVGVGSAALPASIRTSANGTVTYIWCSGSNPELEDGVCEAIASIASDPSAGNPHLSPRAKQSLSLMPEVRSITMDESSWRKTGENTGTMNVTANTADYGDVRLKVTLEKINGTWILTDGALA